MGEGAKAGRLRERLGLLRLLGGYRRLSRRLSRLRPSPPPGDRRVAMLSAYPRGHYGTHSRLTRWIPHLEARGWRVDLLCPVTDERFGAFGRGDVAADLAFHRDWLAARRRDLVTAAGADVVILHRGLFPFGPWQRPTFEEHLARLNPRLVFDFYDSIWEQRRIVAAAARSRLARWLNPADLVERIVGCAAAVTAASEHLAAFARPHCDRVLLLPMTLAPDEYDVVEHGDRDRVVLGWMGGRGNLARLKALAPALGAAARDVDFTLRVISSDPVTAEEFPGVRVESLTHPWSPESERRDLAGLDAGLLPMFDDAEDRGKSPLKLLQYAAAGLPIVAAPIAIDRTKFVAGESILYAEDPDAWAGAIAAVVRDAGLRARLGAAARRVLETEYSFAAHADRYSGLLAEVATAGGAR